MTDDWMAKLGEEVSKELEKTRPERNEADRTFSWGEHDRIVERPPERNRSDRPNADPTQNDDVERWECLDCGLDTQADRGLGVQFSSRSCPPEIEGFGGER